MKHKPRRFVVVSDNHGDMADDTATKALFAFLQDYQPEIRIHAGDNWDFRNLRRGASDEERAASLEDDWTAGVAFMERFFKGGKTNVFLRGNHDERLWDFRESATGLLRDYAADGIKRVEALTKRLNVKMLPYDAETGVYELGKLSVMHGYHCGISAAREHANSYHKDVLFGHVHAFDSASIRNLGGAITSQSMGCMCKTDMPYMTRKTGRLKWGNGWAAGVVYPNGNYSIFMVKRTGNSFLSPSCFVDYGIQTRRH